MALLCDIFPLTGITFCKIFHSTRKKILPIREQQLAKSTVHWFKSFCIAACLLSDLCNWVFHNAVRKARTHVDKAWIHVTQEDLFVNQHATCPRMDTLLAYTFIKNQIISFASHSRLRTYRTNDMQMINHCWVNCWDSKREFSSVAHNSELSKISLLVDFSSHRLFQGV